MILRRGAAVLALGAALATPAAAQDASPALTGDSAAV
jgi:hypothetical protein